VRYASVKNNDECPPGERMRRKPCRRSSGINTLGTAALRVLSICAPAALSGAAATLAYADEPTGLNAGIPAQPLAKALEAFARQTGLQLVYVSDVVRDQRSHAVPAGLGAPDALARMLEGTGLRFDYLTPGSIRILAATVGPPKQTGTRSPAGEPLQEVIVSANRRQENAQHVPMTLQVLTAATLAKLNVTTFDDFEAYLPGVTAHGVGPGQSNIFVRGLATAPPGLQSSGVIGSFPNVAVYLDEQSAQLPNRNLDVYAVDLERIEILEGPQGTLFGAGAEAGVLRYITNKPRLDLAEAKVNAGYATTAHGAPSSNLDATFNMPVIDNRLALRLVIYNEQRGGYIKNVPATFARAPTDPGIVNYFGGVVPANSAVLNNFNIAADAINPVTYKGLRAQVLYRLNDDWDALIAQSNQSIEADGVFTEMAANSLGQPQPDLSVQLYNPSYDKDRFENTALTINGRVGALKLLYAGSYLVRNVEQVQDYTEYARGAFAPYYQCFAPGPTAAAAQCFTPSSTWRDLERNTHESHELRLSTPNEGRVRGVGGLFFEDYRIHEQADFSYLTALSYFNPVGPPTGYYTLNGSPLLPNGTPVRFDSGNGVVFVPAPVTSNNASPRPLGDGYFNDITRGYTQKAAFASVDVELVPDTLTLTGGTRYSRTNTSESGSTVSSSGCNLIAYPNAPNPCVNHSVFLNIDAQHLNETYSGFNSRANLSWKVTEDALLYYTWSQGFRAGGFNRAPVAPPRNSPLAANGLPNQVQAGQHGGYVTSVGFAPDSLTNNEIGWKTLWMDRRIQWNGTLYQENWKHTQNAQSAVGAFQYFIIVNGGSYRVRGAETSCVARLATGFTIEAGAAWNHSELVQQAGLLWRDGTPIDFNALRDSHNQPVPNPSGELGTPLAGGAPFQGNVRARYEFTWNGVQAFAQAGAVRQSHSLATTNRLLTDLQGNSTAYDLPGFTTYSAAVGVARNAWLAQLYGENLTDTRAQLYANYAQRYKAVTVNRPRTIGLRISLSFGGS
jgi:iron complex outermembrane receptor protein